MFCATAEHLDSVTLCKLFDSAAGYVTQFLCCLAGSSQGCVEINQMKYPHEQMPKIKNFYTC